MKTTRAWVSWVSWGSLTPLSHSHKTRWKEREAYHRRNCRKYACNTAWDLGHVQSQGLPYKSGLCIAHSHVERRSSGTTIEILINIWRWVSSSCAIDNGNISSSSSNKVWHVRVPQSRFLLEQQNVKAGPPISSRTLFASARADHVPKTQSKRFNFLP